MKDWLATFDKIYTDEQLEQLGELWLDWRDITEIPNTIDIMKKLVILHLNKNKLSSLPKTIKHLEQLQTLRLIHNNFVEIPKYLPKGLYILDMSDNDIREIPSTIVKLRNLRILDLSSNRIQKIPVVLCRMKHLRELWLGGNDITFVPAQIGRINLDYLSVDEYWDRRRRPIYHTFCNNGLTRAIFFQTVYNIL